MKINTHIKNISENIELALEKNKHELIFEFQKIIKTTKKLFKSDKLDFWLIQLDEADEAELPITKYGISEAKRAIANVRKIKVSEIQNIVSDICEKIFTYSDVDDACMLQSDFHYYFYRPKNIIFKESELGMVAPEFEISSPKDIRIAYKSEIKTETTIRRHS